MNTLKRLVTSPSKRVLTIAGAALATAAVVLVGVLVFTGDGDAAPPTAVAAETTSTIAEVTPTTTTGDVTTTAGVTTTSEPEPTASVRIALEGGFDTSEADHDAVRALYSWLGDRSLEPPPMDPDLEDYLADVAVAADLELSGSFSAAELTELEEGLMVGVAAVGEGDVILLVKHEGEDWTVVGAKLTTFGKDAWYGPELRHVMIIGTDARPGYDQQVFRGDSLHVLTSNIAERGGSIVGFPRDSYVEAPYGFDKFTNVNALAEDGPITTTEIARTLSGLPIEGYIVTGFAGFESLVTDIGGIPVNVPFAMADDKSNAYLAAGLQWLMGYDALAFSRNRTITGGDFTRSFHHGVLMQGALTAVQDRGILDLPFLLDVLMPRTWTDLTPEQLLTVAAGAYELDPALVGNVVLEGTVATRGGASIVDLDTEFAAATWADVADDGMLTPEG
jgi:LCP family protein required for cell wall assembly